MKTSTMPFGERRLLERKPCTRMIGIKYHQHAYAGHLRDLSVGGAFIEAQVGNDTEIGQELLLTIPFGLKRDHINIKAKIAWIKPGGIGVRFIRNTDDRIKNR